MNILIITTYYPPDTAIAAVRPYMFAKYLSRMGHQVTVLRSGLLDCTADGSLRGETPDVRVITYMGEDSASERFERGETIHTQFSGRQSKLDNLPYALRNSMKKVFNATKSMMVGMKVIRAKKRFAMQKACIDSLEGEHFDAVFATFSQLENLFAGQYAAKKFGCKWIMDLRDPIARRSDGNYITYLRWRKIQRRLVQSADVCTAVSAGVAERVVAGTDKKIIALYNGFDAVVGDGVPAPNDGVLRFCYTGVMYENRSSSSLFCAIRQLADEGKLDLDKVRFEYAGPHFEMLLAQAKPYGVEKILIDHGFVSRNEAYEIQCRSDVFLVLSWNTKYELGVLTGKFYEGIRARKPILSLLTGEQPNSELNLLNEKYCYGFCYECCREQEQSDALRNWVETVYICKQAGKPIPYDPKPGLFTDFCYENLAKKLETIMMEMSER